MTAYNPVTPSGLGVFIAYAEERGRSAQDGGLRFTMNFCSTNSANNLAKLIPIIAIWTAKSKAFKIPGGRRTFPNK